MANKPVPIIGSVILVLIPVIALIVVLRLPSSEVEFGRSVLRGLAHGRTSVMPAIDWEHLRALEINIGETYQQLPTETERANYRIVFIRNFSEAFRRTGTRVSQFKNWRIASKRAGQVTVAVDHPTQPHTLLMHVTTAGKKQLVSLQWQS
jgi:hypothetical protein